MKQFEGESSSYSRKSGADNGRSDQAEFRIDTQRKDEAATADHAQLEDGSRRTSEAVLLGAGTASLVAVAFTLAEAGRTHGGARLGLTLFAVTSMSVLSGPSP